MLPPSIQTAPQLAQGVADRVRTLRLRRAWTQQELADRAGMSLSSYRRFERSGRIAFQSLVRIALALDAVDGIVALFPDEPESLEELVTPPLRQRGRSS